MTPGTSTPAPSTTVEPDDQQSAPDPATSEASRSKVSASMLGNAVGTGDLRGDLEPATAEQLHAHQILRLTPPTSTPPLSPAVDLNHLRGHMPGGR